ncbi:MAG: RdgB/HAM1 family non-canonical purine NTP pyrophosphatase [Spirochaetota bacterium]|nr:RdgB/HAM1 family non-canonical purine NTP pyrophosphatase [Spirochaetota bacterium]
MMEIVLATTNNGKIKEISEILSEFPVTLSCLSNYDTIPEIIENGDTFLDNALIKANTVFNVLKKPCLADDSGLVIPIINGEPGVKSARYGCVNDEKPNPNILIQRVLTKMKNIQKESRSAYFKAVIVLIINENLKFIAEAECHGEITFIPKGNHGFGYDPIFYLPEYHKTMAEITTNEKNKISHRAKALLDLKKQLKTYMDQQKIT